MDKVFYHMAKKHYLTGEADWVDDTRMAKIKSRVNDLEYFLCGNEAVDLKMKSAMVSGVPAIYDGPGLYDTTGTLHSIHGIKADITILWFWDSDCGHCKKQTPKLWEMYQKYKEQGKSIEVYAVNVEPNEVGYKKYLREKGYTWINVQDTANLSSFRDYYDIYSTPVAVVLDKEKRIIGKRIDPEAIDRMLEQEFKKEDED
jgi:thiol-disulfide isomerase/thioredoxin